MALIGLIGRRLFVMSMIRTLARRVLCRFVKSGHPIDTERLFLSSHFA